MAAMLDGTPDGTGWKAITPRSRVRDEKSSVNERSPELDIDRRIGMA
ncbi:hypothetical protein AB0I95_05355 [Micromonospora sp. NPDC049751]